MGDVLLWEDEDFRVVTADMKELKQCDLCGRMTRTEWQRKAKKGITRMDIWCCGTHRDEKDAVWNMMLTDEATDKEINAHEDEVAYDTGRPMSEDD